MNIDPLLFAKGASVLRAPQWLEIGVRMREERERLGYSVEEVGIGAGTNAGLIHACEAGRRPLGVNLLYWMARAGADITFVLTGIQRGTPAPTQIADALRALAS